jgi:hypothetical protein
MPYIEERLNEIAQRASNLLQEFGIGGEVKVIKRKESSYKRNIWGEGSWENPDFFFVYERCGQEIHELAAYLHEKTTIRTCLHYWRLDFVEAKLFEESCYIPSFYEPPRILPVPIDFVMAFLLFQLRFLRNFFPFIKSISLAAPINERTQEKSIILEFTFGGTNSDITSQIHIESADRALLSINNQVVFEGTAVETVKFLIRLMALTTL